MEEILLSEKKENKLVYIPELCTGCGVCSQICPKEAVSMGLVGAVARRVLDDYPRYLDVQRCTTCGLCARACPFGALSKIVDGKREVLGTYVRYGTKSTKVDISTCKFCGLCEEVCPSDAIVIERRISDDGSLSFEGSTTVNQDICVHCGWCMQICPTDSIKVEKPFDGVIELEKELCSGCGTCVEACPCDALFLPKESYKKGVDIIKHRVDACIFCGACSNACPNKVIKVKRTALAEGVQKRNALEKGLLKEFEYTLPEFKLNTYENLCHGCGDCMVTCPVNYVKREEITIDVVNGSVNVLDIKECKACGTCVDICPVDAIKLEVVR
ncbi:MAG: 4Fe-4S binding protein [Halobacteriota archaeon]|nr:4Fe-4S binding protein [Halobacteriota archaeon]